MARILIIDDEDMVCATLRHMLEPAGHTVATAANGRVGLETFRQEPFDLVITDIIMPECEGIETILELRRRRTDLAIIAISGGGRSGTTDLLRIAGALGATATLSKPFRGDELLAAVNRVLVPSGSSGSAPA